MRRLFSLGLVGAGAIFALVQACGSSGDENVFPNNGSSGDGGTSGQNTSGFGTSGVGTSGNNSSSGDIDDAGPNPDAPVPVCGNGRQDGADECDDGNTAAGDGCSSACTLEAGWVCTVPGTPCARIGGCGDGKLQNDEVCDDGNTVPGDGCSDCKVDSGWICPIPAAACVAADCGDGILAGNEECDDKDNNNGNGCTNNCTIQDGWKCPTAGQACVRTTCGDGVREGTEQCDDGNVTPFDKCSPTCTLEPNCPKQGGACAGACGDGIVFPGEACDDGNTKAGDGCSPTCTIEQGFECTLSAGSLPNVINSPIIYRDFSRGDDSPLCGGGKCPSAHGDMNTLSANDRGIPGFVLNGTGQTPANLGTLDAEGKPRMVAETSATTTRELFGHWYRTLNGTNPQTRINHTILDTLPLTRQGDGSYQFDSNGSTFFPIDGKGFGNQYEGSATDCGGDHNFHFTSELRFWFQYDQQAINTPPKFDFTGDDDVFVFVNGKFVVDIGGVHGAQSDSFTLTPENATKLGIEKDKVYEFALFQAERNRCESNYKATFRGFARARSVCTPKCGDGFKTPNEVCDDGSQNSTSNTPEYGKCAKDCKSRGGFCGDAVKQDPPETCDDGPFNGGYNKCNATCDGPGPRCGDGKLDDLFGELCDDGANNDTAEPGATAYGKCSKDCRVRPRCGDGIKNGPEACDPAVPGGPACKPDCTLDNSGPK